ncbi:MAG: hypothetical protein ABID45_02715 [Patescibacteria group bacterium]
MKKITTTLLIIAISLIIITGIIYLIYYFVNENNKTEFGDPSLPSYMQACEKDDDCIKTKTRCCGCGMGGFNITINKNYVEEYVEEYQSKGPCEGSCIAAPSEHISCYVEPQCKRSKCQFIAE